METVTITYNIYTRDEVKEVVLLSSREWQKANENESGVPYLPEKWWLKDVYFDGVKDRTAGCVELNKELYRGCYADFPLWIRPAFIIPEMDLEIGSKIYVEQTPCTVIDKNYALSDKCILRHPFNSSSRVQDFEGYDDSEVRNFINSNLFWICL